MDRSEFAALARGRLVSWGNLGWSIFSPGQQSQKVIQQQAQQGGVMVLHGKGSDLFLEVAVFSGPIGTARWGRSCWYVSAGPSC